MYRLESPPYRTKEPFHLRRFPVLSCLVTILDLQEVLGTHPELCDVDQNLHFVSISAPPPFQLQASYLEHEVSELPWSWHIRPKLPIHQELCRRMNTLWKVELTCTLQAPDTAHHLSLKPSSCLPLIQPLHYSSDNMGWWLRGETDTLLRTYRMHWSQIAIHYLYQPLGYAIPCEDVLTMLYYWLNCCSIQLCYLYKSGVEIHDYKIWELLQLHIKERSLQRQSNGLCSQQL